MTSLFRGNWAIDLTKSFIWDYAGGAYMPDLIGEERIFIDEADNEQTYEVLLGDGPVIRIGYSSKYDSPEWVPYSVREISGFRTADHDRELEDFITRTRQRIKSFAVGDVYGMVRTVFVDAHTHYRISRNVEGQAEYSMMRRMDPSGDAYTAYVLRTDGIVSTIRRFVRAGSLD